MVAMTLITAAVTPAGADQSPPADIAAALQARDPRQSTQQLYEDCTSTIPERQMFCDGFIIATWDHMWLLGASKSTRAMLGICTNTPVSYGAAEQAFKNWAQKHPEKWNVDMMYGAMWALQEVWPCK